MDISIFIHYSFSHLIVFLLTHTQLHAQDAGGVVCSCAVRQPRRRAALLPADARCWCMWRLYVCLYACIEISVMHLCLRSVCVLFAFSAHASPFLCASWATMPARLFSSTLCVHPCPAVFMNLCWLALISPSKLNWLVKSWCALSLSLNYWFTPTALFNSFALVKSRRLR